jgi:hypothetical protein
VYQHPDVLFSCVLTLWFELYGVPTLWSLKIVVVRQHFDFKYCGVSLSTPAWGILLCINTWIWLIVCIASILGTNRSIHNKIEHRICLNIFKLGASKPTRISKHALKIRRIYRLAKQCPRTHKGSPNAGCYDLQRSRSQTNPPDNYPQTPAKRQSPGT